ncbi:MAG: hypothetical protein AAB757_01960 [Patescibacteria group bacterium]
MNKEIVLPKFALMLIDEIARNKNSHIQYGDNEISVIAPDPGEEGEEEAFLLIGELHGQLEKEAVKHEIFTRNFDGGEKIDAIRISFKSKFGG